MDWTAIGFIACGVLFIALCVIDVILSAVSEAIWGRGRKR